jgi:hypothetical protein
MRIKTFYPNCFLKHENTLSYNNIINPYVHGSFTEPKRHGRGRIRPQDLWVNLPTPVRDGCQTLRNVSEIISCRESSTISSLSYLPPPLPPPLQLRPVCHTESGKICAVHATAWRFRPEGLVKIKLVIKVCKKSLDRAL